MTSPRKIALVLAAATLAVVSLAPDRAPFAPRDCAAQEATKKDEPLVTRSYDLAAIGAPAAPDTGSALRSARPFAWLESESASVELEQAEPAPDSDAIAEIVRSVLPPEVAERSTVEFTGPRLRVESTADGHRRVQAVIEELRRTVGAPVECEVRAVTLGDGADADALVAEVTALAGAPVPDALRARLLAADVERGARGGTTSGVEGRWSVLRQTRSRPVVSDWDVEIAQAASIADPIPLDVEEGLRAAVRAGRMLDGRSLLTVAAASGDAVLPFRRVEMRTKDLGVVEMPEVRTAFVCANAVVKVGDTVALVAGSAVSDRAAVRRVVLVRVLSMPPAPEIPGSAVLPLPYARDDTALRIDMPDDPQEDRDDPRCVGFSVPDERAVEPEWIVDDLRKAEGSGLEDDGNALAWSDQWPCGGALLVHGAERWRKFAADFAAQREREEIVPVWVSARVVARSDGAEKVVATLAGPALVGRFATLAAFTSVPYLRDYDVEVAQEARIADPIPHAAVGGTIVTLRLQRAAGNAFRAQVRYAVASVGEPEAAPVSATEVGIVERVTTRSVRGMPVVALESGREKEIDLGANPFGAGRLFLLLRADAR